MLTNATQIQNEWRLLQLLNNKCNKVPEEYEKCLVGLTAILKEAWNTAQNTQETREKIQALSLAKDCYSMKLELLTNATVVDDAIRFLFANLPKEREIAKDDVCITNEDTTLNDIQGFEEENIESGESNTTNKIF